MTEHVTIWLEAYHDGELQGRRLRQVEAHLAHCATCCAELERLRALTALLQESPAAESLTSPERFVAQVGLRLPRRPLRPAWQKALEFGWRLVPLGLIGVWIFVQTVFVVTRGGLVALQMGLGGDVVAGLLPAWQQGAWLAEMLSLSGADMNGTDQVVLQWLSNGELLGWTVVLNVILSAVIGLLYWSWLASWWARRRRRQHQV
jgi:anti-sigma factor RsiW